MSVGDWIRKAHLVFRVQYEAMGKKAGAKKKVKDDAKKKVKKDSANVAEQSHEPMDKSEISAMLGYLKYHAAQTTPTGSLAKNALALYSQSSPACKRKFLGDFKENKRDLSWTKALKIVEEAEKGSGNREVGFSSVLRFLP